MLLVISALTASSSQLFLRFLFLHAHGHYLLTAVKPALAANTVRQKRRAALRTAGQRRKLKRVMRPARPGSGV